MKHLYIHIPFCKNKCDYCAFYSLPNSQKMIPAYLSHLNAEFAKQKKIEPLESIFIGGGTPTILSEKDLALLFESIYKHFKSADTAEISIECNPEPLSDAKVTIIAKYANRISLGVQSFNQKHRDILGRSGDVNSVYKAIELINKYNLTNYNIDLIYGIPEQTISNYKNDLEKAISLGIKHLSAYSLSIEENAVLAKKDIEIDDDFSTDMFLMAKDILEQNKIYQYEISNFSKKGYECKHNLQIWKGDKYLGLGPNASSYNGDRWTEVDDLDKWLKSEPPEFDKISSKYRAIEIFIMGLRTVNGWELKDFQNKTGYDYNLWIENIEVFRNKTLVNREEEKIKLTQKGLLFWDSIAEELII